MNMDLLDIIGGIAFLLIFVIAMGAVVVLATTDKDDF